MHCWTQKKAVYTSHALRFHFFFPLILSSFLLSSRLPPPPPSILSLYTLMHRLEQTRARIRKEQDDRTQKRLQQLRVQAERETLLLEKRTKELSDRTLSLSHQTQSLSRLLFDARREGGIHIEVSDRDIVKILLSIVSPLLSFVCLSCFLSSLSLRRLVWREMATRKVKWTSKAANGRKCTGKARDRESSSVSKNCLVLCCRVLSCL